jgi:hypothetical protein
LSLRDALKKHWRELAHEQPGLRFQRRYERNRGAGHALGRALRITAGIVLIVIGAVLLLIPGPGTVVIVVGAALLAQESAILARLLDRLELRLRDLIPYASKHWHRAGRAVRAFVIVCSLLVLGGAAWAAYSILQRSGALW